MRTYLVFPILLITILVYSQESATTSDALADNQLKEAQQLLTAGKLDEPLILLQKALDHYQQKDNDNIQLAEIHYYLGLCFYNKGLYDESSKNYKAGLTLFLKHGMNHRIADCYNGIGNTVWWQTNDNQQALNYFQQAITIFNEKPKTDHERHGIYYKDLGSVLTYMGKYNEAEVAIQKSLKINIENVGMLHRNTALSLFTLGQLMQKKEDNFQAANAFEQAIKIYENLYGVEGHPDLGAFYGELGGILISMGDYPKALEYYKKGATYIPIQLTNGNGILLRIAIGDCYSKLGETKKALETYQSVLDENKIVGYSSAIFGLGICKMDMGAYKEAEKLFDDAEIYIGLDYGKGSIQMGKFYESAAASLTTAKRYEKVSFYLDKAISIYRDSFQTPNLIGVARSLNTKGALWASVPNRDSAIYFYNKALTIIAPDKNNFQTIAFPKEYISFIWNIGDSYRDKYFEGGNKEDLVAAIKNFEILANYLDHYRIENYSEASLAFLNQENHILYQRLVELNYELGELEGGNNIKVPSRAFEYSEKSTAYLLLRSLRNARFFEQTEFGDSLTNINKGITYYQQEIFQKQKQSNTPVKELEGELFNLRRRKEALQKQIQKKLPLFQEINSAANLVTIEKLQNDILKPGETFLKYFITLTDVYAFIIQKNKFEFVKIRKDFPLDTLIEEMRNCIYAFSIDNGYSINEYNPSKEKYVGIAHQLYQKLIYPIQGSLSKQLIIAPDDILGYLPFDALLEKTPDDIDNPRSYPYLILNYQISYAYSATFLQEMKMKRHNATKSLLAFAPEFLGQAIAGKSGTNVRSGLPRLDHNILEVKSICNIVGSGKIFTNQSATLSNFYKKASDYQVIHLSTHSKVDDRGGDYSYVAFAEVLDSLAKDKLYIHDLYNLKLNAEMVILSACETVLGELQSGEGVLSLSRGFIYAGAKSIISTLWSVNDKSTRIIMERFYSYLKNGYTKDAALRQAKIDFLKNESNAQPFFWAAFIPIGDMEMIDFHGGNGFWVWLITGLVSLVFLILIVKKGKRLPSKTVFNNKTS